MGPIVDRTKENLVSTDNGIIMARKVLKRAVIAFVTKDKLRQAFRLKSNAFGQFLS